mmetsp:Transcript_101778/g.308840  ORF Transcript_101778/g.308840 Transcript_101778/m.308840 type:complete len:334 (-) Transcript_101778:14-1015(-)
MGRVWHLLPPKETAVAQAVCAQVAGPERPEHAQRDGRPDCVHDAVAQHHATVHPSLPQVPNVACPPQQLSAVDPHTVHTTDLVLEDKGTVLREYWQKVPRCHVRPELPEQRAVCGVESAHHVVPRRWLHIQSSSGGGEQDVVLDAKAVDVHPNAARHGHRPDVLPSFQTEGEYDAGRRTGVQRSTHENRHAAHGTGLDVEGPQSLPVEVELPDAVQGRQVDVPILVDERPTVDHRVVLPSWVVPGPGQGGREVPRPHMRRVAEASIAPPGARPVVGHAPSRALRRAALPGRASGLLLGARPFGRRSNHQGAEPAPSHAGPAPRRRLAHLRGPV